MNEPIQRLPNWTYEAASRTVPFVRMILCRLREGFITLWHLYRVSGCGANAAYSEQMQWLREEGLADLDELKRLGILPYERATRGIALFPFVVDDAGKPRQAYFLYKDSRDGIDSFILNDDLCERNDLLRDEWPVPDEWKKSGAVPKLREVLP